VDEVGRALSIHKNTVREWLKRGLRAIDGRRRTLIVGRELRSFLETRRAARKRPCPPGTMYCVRCKTPRRPAGGMVDYRPLADTRGNLTGICPVCEALMNRCVSLAKLGSVCADLEIAFPQQQRSLGDCS
jgi:hypothetical protein